MLMIKTLILAVLVPGTILFYIPYLLLSSGLEGGSIQVGCFRCLGVIPFILGIVCCYWSVRDFIVIGKGTPAPFDPPKKFVSTGLFQVVRNPMFIGVILILLSEVIYFGSLTLLFYTLFWVLFVYLFVVYYEEPSLKKRFGKEYEAYLKNVPRWIPKIRKKGK